MTLSPAKQKFVDLASAKYGEGEIITKQQVIDVKNENNLGWPSWFVRQPYTVARGQYKLPVEGDIESSCKTHQISPAALAEKAAEIPATAANLMMVTDVENMVPEKFNGFVPWGHFTDVNTILSSGMFYPIFITGLTGNGKTTMVEQICAKLKRECYRVNITRQTDEDDLLGGFRLINGNTVWQDGPVVSAMKSGGVLLLDEIDLGGRNLMCLQSVLEGKGIFLKKIGKYIKPATGFNVIATANTKGKGSDDGRFIAANIIDEAFLERFTITMEQPYPSTNIEKKIVLKHMDKFGKTDEAFAETLTTWSETIRKTFLDGGIDDLISTRRLCHIVQTFSIFNDRLKSIELCVNRFDEDTKTAFLDLYEKVDASVSGDAATSFDEMMGNPVEELDNLINEVS